MPATLRVPVAGWPKKRELGPLSSGQGKLMQFVDPDRIEQIDRVQAASFAPGLYIISTINESIKFESIGLYRDDGLAELKSATGSESERMRKRLIKTFQDNDLSISSQTNITSTNFLDITLNLTTESYKPYRKPNDQPLYIDKYSNHLRHIIKTLPNTISKRISELSSTKKDFEEAAPIYIEAS